MKKGQYFSELSGAILATMDCLLRLDKTAAPRICKEMKSNRRSVNWFKPGMNRAMWRNLHILVPRILTVGLAAALLIPSLWNPSPSSARERAGRITSPIEQIEPVAINNPYSFQPVILPIQSQEGGALVGLGSFHAMDSSADGNLIVTAGSAGIFVWNLRENPTAPVVWRPAIGERIQCLDISPDDRYLAFGTDKGNLFIWDTAAWKPVYAKQIHTANIPALAFSPDSNTVAAACAGGLIRMISVAKGEPIKTLNYSYTHTPSMITFSPKGDEIAVPMEYSPDCYVFNIATGENTQTYRSCSQSNPIAYYSPDGKSVFLSEENFTLQEIDRKKGYTLDDFTDDKNLLSGHKREIRSLAFSPDGKRMITGSMDGTAKLWDRESRREIVSIGEYYPRVVDSPRRIDNSNSVCHVRFLPDGNRVLIGNQNGTITIIDLTNKQTVLSLPGYSVTIASYALFKDGSRLMLGCSDGTVKIQDIKTGQIQSSFSGHADYVCDLAIAADESKFVSRDREGYIHYREMKTGKLLHSWGDEKGEAGRNDWFGSMCFSPDEKYLLAGDTYVENDNGEPFLEVKWFELDGGQLTKVWRRGIELEGKITTRENQRYGVDFKFYPDKSKALMPVMGKAQVWDVEKGQFIPGAILGDGYTTPQCFSPDGKYAVLAGSRLELWDTQTAQRTDVLADTLRNRYYYFNTVSFSSDGKWLAAGDNEGTIMIWDFADKKVVCTLENPGRPITFLQFTPDNAKLVMGTYEGAMIRDVSQTTINQK